MTTPTEHAEADFATALAAFQADMPRIGKDQTASVRSEKGSYSYSYAELSDITHAALPLLAKHGFAWSCKTMASPAGFLLLSSLKHSSGWSETCEWPLPDPSKASAQQVGSALTYGRRYTFTALTGIAPGGEDDDAQAASTRPAADRLPRNRDGSVSKRQTTEEQRVAVGMASKEQEREHKTLVAETFADDKKAERLQPDPQGDDPWATIQVTPPGSDAWLVEWGAELEAAKDLDTLRKLLAELKEKRRGGGLNDAQYETAETTCKAMADAMKAEQGAAA